MILYIHYIDSYIIFIDFFKKYPYFIKRRFANMKKSGILKEFWEFLMETKKWWIAPIIIVLVLMGLVIILTEGSVVAPLIYTIF